MEEGEKDNAQNEAEEGEVIVSGQDEAVLGGQEEIVNGGLADVSTSDQPENGKKSVTKKKQASTTKTSAATTKQTKSKLSLKKKVFFCHILLMRFFCFWFDCKESKTYLCCVRVFFHAFFVY